MGINNKEYNGNGSLALIQYSAPSLHHSFP